VGRSFPAPAAYFFPGGKPLQVGQLLKNPEYAETLTRVADEGIDAFYTGELAAAIAKAAQEPPNGGTLTVEDIANYEVLKREVVCGDFRALEICTTTPPSSGGAQIMIAGLYDYLIDETATQDDRIAAFVDAQRLAYADRDHFFYAMNQLQTCGAKIQPRKLPARHIYRLSTTKAMPSR
jgi:gamma-glutamyltranspeptidase/glutathione hydrolase